MIVTLKALAAMLLPPCAGFKAATWDVADAMLAEDRLAPEVRRQLLPLLDEFHEMDLCNQQERFVALFGHSPALSLNLCMHMPSDEYTGLSDDPHGDKSDYLPHFLNTLAGRPEPEIRQVLAEAAPVFALLAIRLEAIGSSYAGVFRALLYLGATARDLGHRTVRAHSPYIADRPYKPARSGR
ncbi:hypothetical protein [Rhodovulum steppense]|uniref:Respiratory nitrate reductase chaperone NarJ n=1 Tax=Rhodovulum steppense TaxID=540251 RepID=A0A4R1YTF3_9RHOB|nr:hypothetical protein [Rhodovulum steppense]TCM83546.1 respiratory nitrate reductase chaperone NarJ [Rhodovulum steppense]